MAEYGNNRYGGHSSLRSNGRTNSGLLPTLPHISSTGSVNSSYSSRPRHSIGSQSSSRYTTIEPKQSETSPRKRGDIKPLEKRTTTRSDHISSKKPSVQSLPEVAVRRNKSRSKSLTPSDSRNVAKTSSSHDVNERGLYNLPRSYSNGTSLTGTRATTKSSGYGSYTSPSRTTFQSSSKGKIDHDEVEKIAQKYRKSVCIDDKTSGFKYGSSGASSSGILKSIRSGSAIGAEYKGDGLVGLKNLGNTCFMNSIIQCLSHSRVVRDYFLSRKYKEHLSGASKMQGRLAEEFASLLSDMWSGKSDVVTPNKFKSAVAKSAPRFVGYSQQDSQEFLRFFLEGLHEDLNRGKKGKRRMEDPPNGLSDAQLADHRWQEYLAYDNSSIVNIFVGLLKSTLTCSVCNHKSVTFDPFWDLSLPLPRSKGSCPNLQSCFSEFTQEEILDGEEKPTCESCKKRQKCTKQFSIERFPPILVLHLKRFSEVRYRTKLSTKVDFPVDSLDLSDFASGTELDAPRYDLVGVSNHSGNTFSGHYIAYCRTTGRWHRFSDSSVSSLSRSDIVSPEAYVLFYERKS